MSRIDEVKRLKEVKEKKKDYMELLNQLKVKNTNKVDV